MNPVTLLKLAKYGLGIAGAIAYGVTLNRIFDPLIERADRAEVEPPSTDRPVGPPDGDYYVGPPVVYTDTEEEALDA